MSGWEATYGLLVVQVTLMSVMAGIAYLMIARRQPMTARRFLGVTVLLLLGLTTAAGLPLPGFWSLDVWPKETAVAPPVEPPSADPRTIVRETEALIGIPDVSWTGDVEPTSGSVIQPDPSDPAPSRPTTVAFRWGVILGVLLLAGCFIAGIRLVLGLWSTRRMLTRARKVDDATFVELAEEIRRSVGCRPVELRVSAEIASAATVGWRRPALVVAADWQQWSEQELRTVVAHEMMHVRSNDYLTGLVARVTMVLYFYHPLVRWLGTRFFLAQEAAADAAAARLVGGRANYLAALSRIALRQDRRITSLPVLAFASSFSTFLMRRIEMLETKDGRRSPAMRVLQGVTLAGLCLGAIVVSALRTPAQDGESTSEIDVPEAREEAAQSTDGDADSTAQGVSKKGEALPPLPTSATYKSWCVFQDGSAFATRHMVLGRHLTRTEGPGQTVKISNHGKRLSLYAEDKEAIITEAPEDYQGLGYFGSIRRSLTDAEYASGWKQRQMLGESEIGGRTAVGYRFIHDRRIRTYWVDPDSLLPIQIEMVDQMYPHMMSIETDFVYKVALDESLFSLDPPADYTVTVRPCPKEPAPCQEIDLIETFRQYREHNQGTFPETLDTSSTNDLVARKRRALGDTPTAQQLDDLSEFNSRVNDGLRFVVHLPTEADAHYAGKGVKVDATDAPIFWYRPEGKAKYRVIRADLSVVEMDSPPQVPGALSLNDWDRLARGSRRPWRNPAAAHDVQNLTALARQIGIVPNT